MDDDQALKAAVRDLADAVEDLRAELQEPRGGREADRREASDWASGRSDQRERRHASRAARAERAPPDVRAAQPRAARRDRRERLGLVSGERSEPRAASGANDDTLRRDADRGTTRRTAA